MDESAFKERAKRLQAVNQIISQLDPAIRQSAFLLLQEYITSTQADGPRKDKKQLTRRPDIPDDKEKFFSRFDHDKPSENVLLVAAYYYSQYGAINISQADVKKIADETGLTTPERIDKTIEMAKRKKKNLFRKVVKGEFRPTVHGELYFKETYSVSKGNRTKPPEENE